MRLQYILDGHKNPIPCTDIISWGEWMEFHNRQVGYDVCDVNGVKFEISTVFLGINHEFLPNHPPVLFETMVFTPDDYGVLCRYRTWSDALAGHRQVHAVIENKLKNDAEVTMKIVTQTLETARGNPTSEFDIFE